MGLRVVNEQPKKDELTKAFNIVESFDRVVEYEIEHYCRSPRNDGYNNAISGTIHK